jgi:TRAP-type mannitol/chloroaromatic compound transport system substrate-binding protein
VALDTIFGGAQVFAERVATLTGGKFTITPRAAGELAPGLEVLNVVQEGAVPIGHTASYYYVGKSPVTAFGTALPFGLTNRQQNAWLYEAGGLKLLQDAYAEKFGVIQFPAGNTGVQMGGWFNKEIKSTADLQGLKMRIPGLGGRVMDKLGVTVQVLPGGEIFQALQTGAIDAAEWVGPYDDEKLGFHKVTKFYYYPGWWEPGPGLEVEINLNEWNNLPELYQEVIKTAAYEANIAMMARYDAKNPAALERLLNESEIQLLPFPDDVMQAAEEASFALFDEFSAADSTFGSILKEWLAFRDSVQKWHGFAETAYLAYAAKG